MELKNNESVIIAVKDELTGTFMTPIFLKGKTWKEEATRLFKHQVNSIPLWKSNPNDYSLYKLGVFDEEKGFLLQSYEDETGIEKIVSGRSVLKE